MEQPVKRRAPTLGAIYGTKRSRTSPFCRITGKSHSMDEHHYVPSLDDYPKFENLHGCRITEKHSHFKDYKYVYPIIDLDGTTRMVTERDFHCRITAKYRAMAGYRYLYPVLGISADKTVDDMVSVADEDSMCNVLIPAEVELIVRGGIEDVLKLKDSEHLFIYSKEKSLFPAALKEIPEKKKLSVSKYGRRHTLPISLEAGLAGHLEESIKTLKDLKKPVMEVDERKNVGESKENKEAVFGNIPLSVAILKDVRKTRPKRPGKPRKQDKELSSKILTKIDGPEPEKSDAVLEKENVSVSDREIKTGKSKPKLSRLERYKLQFSDFEEKDSGNRLIPVGTFDESEVVELDFSDSVQVEYGTFTDGASSSSTEQPLVAFSTNGETVTESKMQTEAVSNVKMISVRSGEVVDESQQLEEYHLRRISASISQLNSASQALYSNTAGLDSENVSELSHLPATAVFENKAPHVSASGPPCEEISNKTSETASVGAPTLEKNASRELSSAAFADLHLKSASENSSLDANDLASKENNSSCLGFKLSDENGMFDAFHSLRSEAFLREETDGKFSSLEQVPKLKRNLTSWESFENLIEISESKENEAIRGETKNTTITHQAMLPDISENQEWPVFIHEETAGGSSIKVGCESKSIGASSEKGNIREVCSEDESYSSVGVPKDSCKDKEIENEREQNKVAFANEKERDATEHCYHLNLLNEMNASPDFLPSSAVGTKVSGINNEDGTFFGPSVAFGHSENATKSKYLENILPINDDIKEIVNSSSGKECPEEYSRKADSSLKEKMTTINSKTDENNSGMKERGGLFSGKSVLQFHSTHETLHTNDNQILESRLANISANGFTRAMPEESRFKGVPNQNYSDVNGNFVNHLDEMLSDCNRKSKSSDVLKFSSHFEDDPREMSRDSFSQKCVPVFSDSDILLLLSNSLKCSMEDSEYHRFRMRLPVTCSLLEKDKQGKCEHDSSISSLAGSIATMSSSEQPTESANWNRKQSIDIYVAIMDFQPMESDEEAVVMKEGQQVEVIDASKPRRWLVRTVPLSADEVPKEGWVPACYLEKSTAYDTLSRYVVTEAEFDPKELEAVQNREAIVKEMVETEEDFAKDMQYVVDNYYKQMDNPRLPKEFRDRKGSIFGNFKDISDFHNNVLIKGVQYHAKEPTKLGKTFLRLERDFDMHSSYCWNEARAQQLLKEGPLKEFFDDHSRMIDDDKLLVDHLKLPIQRLNDYQLLLKELIKYSSRLNEDTTDLQKALDFIHSINKRTKDLQIIQAIHGCRGDLLKLGRVIKHEILDVIEGDAVQERYVFLFKGRLFITEKQIASGKESYHVTNLFKLQDVDIIENVDHDPVGILFQAHKKNKPGFPLLLRTRSIDQKVSWCKELAAANQAVEDLGDLEPSTERPVDIIDHEPIELKHKAEAAAEEPELKKPKVEPLKRQDSVKRASFAESSAPQTPVGSDVSSPLTRQNSEKKTFQSSDSSAAQVLPDSDKASKLNRQDSEGKKTRSSAPPTPTDSPATEPSLAKQDSSKKKQKKAFVPDKETDSVDAIPEENKNNKGKAEEASSETKFGRQDSVSKKEKKGSAKQSSQSQGIPKDEAKPAAAADQPKRGEAISSLPKVIMSEEISGFESAEFGEDSATVANESLRSDESLTASEGDPMDKPRFSKTLRGVTCALGDTAVLECETKGTPEPSVTWLKDNQKLAKSNRVETSSKGQKHSLTLREVSAEDGGLYTVIASSAKGTASCSAPLNLKIPLLGLPKEDSRPTTPGGTVLPHAPVFKVKLNKETQLLEGTSVRFELVVRGNPEPEVKFYKDGKELRLDERIRVSYESREVFELILDHVVAKDAGTYSCVATNSEGEDKTVGNLSVVKHKDVFKGLESLEEEREPSPRPRTPKFKWFKDGQYFEANERFQVIFNEEEDSLALMFQHVTPEDAGLYTCVASTSTGSKIACSAELTVQGVIRQVETPAIKAELADVEATEGGSAMLELKITGYPKPKVTWYHKNKEVSTGGRFRFLFADEETFTLVIKNVKKDDSGKYSVKATNEMGEAESSCNLTVKSSPSFVKGLKDMSVMAEEIIKFEVEIDGNPAPDVKWYKDGQQLNKGDRVKITEEAGKCVLQIAKAKLTDSGSYSCVLTNNLGSQAEFSNIVVKASPTFIKGMGNTEGLEGDSLQFSVEINGNPKPSIKWTKDGRELLIDGKHIKVIEEGANSYSLVIDKATAADVGIYTCELRNEHGLKASSGDLHLRVKPEFIKKLSDMECNEGDSSVILNTTVKGYPCPSVTWLLNDIALTDDKNYIVSSEKDNHNLKIKKATKNIAGKYTCEATNEMGKASTSGKLIVNVVIKKPQIEQDLKETQLVEGKPGKLTARISGEPEPEIKWLKDGNQIVFGDHFYMEEGEDGIISLVFDKVSPSDSGLYSIVACNHEGEAKSEAVVTTIPAGQKPEFIKELEKIDLVEGQLLSLKAKVVGKPTSIKWQKDGEDISTNDNINITEGSDGLVSLTIEKVTQSDAGKYTIIASNVEGKARTASLVQVRAVKEPEIESSLEPLTLKDGETGSLKAKVSGQPKPVIKWLKDGKELKQSNRVECIEEPDEMITLVIKNSRPDDAGNYTIVAENIKGEAKSSAAVLINQAPTFQKSLEPVNVVEGYPAKLEAKLSGSPPPEIKWFKDGQEIIADGSHLKEIKSSDGVIALLIENCRPEDAGKYMLLAKNSLGESSSSGNVGVSGKDSFGVPKSAPCFITPLGNITVREGEPIKLEVDISGNPYPDISWIVNEKPVIPSDNVLMTFDGKKAVLEIRRSSPDDIGIYQCKLFSPLGETSSEGSVSIQEKSAPHFIQRLNDFTGFVNQPLKLLCKVTGYPEPEVDWYFNGDLISPNNPRYNVTKYGDAVTLNIHSCQPDNSGIYECKAKNSLGEDHTRSVVDISEKVEKGEPPMFLKKIGDNEVMEGMTAKFTACITGIPTPDISWVKEGNPLEPSPRHKMELESTGILRLIIRDVDSSDYGNYSVTISNIHGSATSSAKLSPDSLDQKYITPIGDQFVDFDKFKKTGAPVPLPEKPRVIRMDDNSLTLGWKPSVPNAPRVPVTYQLEIANHPDGEWSPYKIGLKDTLCDVRDLRPGQDYKFRIRVENKHGISEPSPYTTAHRSKIYQLPKPEDFAPKDYEIGHLPLQKYAVPPSFLHKEEDTVYGVRGQPVTIQFWVYGHPEPQITWFKGESQIGKDMYTFMQDRNGKLCVFINCMTDDYVGLYTCLAVNSEGEATMKVKLLVAEPPVFIEKLDETTAMSRRSGRMQCRVTGLPYPKIKWFRDWHPLYESERIKVLWEEPDKCTLFISNLITRDNALYSCTATNIAGTVTSSAILNVEDTEDMFDAKTYCRPTPVKTRTKMFEDFYDIGDELGRGTQGITYHAVKRETGDSYAAKSMHGKGKLKDFMKSEMDIMNQLCHPKLVRLRDGFETKDTLTLVTDICGGGEILGSILKRGGVSEREVAHYIKQLLEGLDYMHSRYVGHLGLTIGDILVARVNSYDIKFGDFGLATRLLPGKDYFLEYGHPEYVAPEIANKQSATLLSDMWSVGVITYLLLSGISPFLGENDRETLTRVQEGKINFIEDAFIGVTDDAKDFMSKLLVFDPKGRMDVKSALNHRWLKYYAGKPTGSEKMLNNLDRLKDYQRNWQNWYANASCKRYYRRRTLESCFHHPSRMIYPPGESYTPPSSPEPDLDKMHIKPSQFDDITFKQKINREEIDFRSESNYQNGPDTYLLQLRDTDFPLRLRQYLRVGASTSPTLAASLRDQHWGDNTLVIRERRKFVDIMDEEIDDERKGLTTRTVPRRLYHEVGTLGFAREQMELLKKEVWKDRGSREIEIGMAPFFREKIRTTSMKEGDEVVFRCLAIGQPKADYSWFRNDGILLESSRIMVKLLKSGHCELRINPTRAYDAGVYKCVARNMHGVSCCRARLKLGSKPGRPEAPVVKGKSDTEIYITWAVPRDEGQSTTLGYTLEYKKTDEEQWAVVSHNAEHEYFVVRNLLPSTFYQFRVKAYNKFGWGEPGFPTEPISTKPEGAEKVKVSPRRKYQQEFTERTPDYELKEIELPELDYSQESNPVPIVEGDTLELYRIVSEMDRGRFSVVLNVWVKESNTSSIAKVIQTTDFADGKQEYEIMKSLCHERIVILLSASFHLDKTVLVMEKLSGVDVMSYLALRHDYNEELVVIIIRQVLEALQYLHFREICYLELQPDNVVMVNLRDSDIKLVDFGSARFVSKAGGKVNIQGTLEYLAPEILKNEEVSSLTDVWCVGVLTYILLSGVSPFRGKDDDETKENVSFVRYHFDSLHSDVTSEVTRFLLNIFKQCPIKRLTIDECLEHKWLSMNEYMIMKRESARFLPDKLASFAKKFHADKYEAMNPELLTSLGMSSTKQELIIDF